MLPGGGQQLRPEADRVPRVRGGLAGDGPVLAPSSTAPPRAAISIRSPPLRSLCSASAVPSERAGHTRRPSSVSAPRHASEASVLRAVPTSIAATRPPCPLAAVPLTAQSPVDIPYAALRSAERAHAARPRGPQGADRRGERLVPCRLEERAPGPHRLRAPLRAPDVQRQRALQQGVLQGPLERVGATELNGTTNEDRTNYFAERPDLRARPGAVARVGPHGTPGRRHRPGQARRAARRGPEREAAGRERAVRQGRGIFLTPRLYPDDHPYSWTVIGSMEDLDAAVARRREGLVPDLLRPGQRHARHRRRRGRRRPPRQKVEKYFGDIPSGPPVARQGAWIAKRTGSQRGIDAGSRAADAALQGLERARVAARRTPTISTLAASTCSAPASRPGSTSGWSTRIRSRPTWTLRSTLREIGGLFSIEAGVRARRGPGQGGARGRRGAGPLHRVGPTAVELHRAKTQCVRATSSAASSGSAASAANPTCSPGPGVRRPARLLQGPAERIAGATAAQTAAARPTRWLRTASTRSRYSPSPSTRRPRRRGPQKLPDAGDAAEGRIPRARSARRSRTGSRSSLAQRPSIPQVQFDLLLDAGFAADQFAEPGTASLAMSMLDEGTTTRSRAPDQRSPRGSGRHARHQLATSIVHVVAGGAHRGWSHRSSCSRTWCCIPRSDRRTSSGSGSNGWFRSSGRRPTPSAWLSGSSRGRVRRGPRLRNPVDRIRHRGLDGQDHAGRPGQVSPDLVQAQPCHAHRRRRHHDGRDQAQARAALRRLAARATSRQKNIAAVPRSDHLGVPFDRPGAIQIGAHRRRPRAAARQSRREPRSRP